jgi:antitoxin (DNA-binding transcriptional repressor) of toxin-antitoxin stability system
MEEVTLTDTNTAVADTTPVQPLPIGPAKPITPFIDLEAE